MKRDPNKTFHMGGLTTRRDVAREMLEQYGDRIEPTRADINALCNVLTDKMCQEWVDAFMRAAEYHDVVNDTLGDLEEPLAIKAMNAAGIDTIED